MEDNGPRGEKVPKNSKVLKVEERKRIPGVIYVGHLPWGFEEKGLREYFTQFGTVKNLRLARSQKTGNSKGYAFVKFAHDEVAKIAADSMDNYLMFGKLLKCKHIKDVHPSTFRGGKGPPKPKWERALSSAEKKLAKHSKTSICEKDKNVLKRYKRKMKKMKQLGLDYSIEELENQINERRAKVNNKKLESQPEADKDGRDDETDLDDSDSHLEALNGIDNHGSNDDCDDDDDDDDDEDDSSDDDSTEHVNSKSIKRSTQVSKSSKMEKPTSGKNVQNTPKSSKKNIKADKGAKQENDKLDDEISFKTPRSTTKRVLSTGQIKSSKKDQTPKSLKDTFDETSSQKKLHPKKAKKNAFEKEEEKMGFITPQNRRVQTSQMTASKSTPGGMKRKHSSDDRSKHVQKSSKKRYFGEWSMSANEPEKIDKTTEVAVDSPQTVKKQKHVKDSLEAKLNRSKNTPLKQDKEIIFGNNEKGIKTPGTDKSDGKKFSRKSLGTPIVTRRMKTPSHGKRKKSL